MPWIDPKYLDCVIYLYPSEAAAEDGDRIGGTGFVLAVPLEDTGFTTICVVTNRHVIYNGNMVVRLNTRDGGTEILALDEMKWFEHSDGDDIALCPVRLAQHHKVVALPFRNLLTRKHIEDHDIGPGDDVFIVGRFINHEGQQRNLPSVRFGNISQMPLEPIVVEGFPQESFLIEGRSIGGYSGAPVFVQIAPGLANVQSWDSEVLDALKSGAVRLPGISPKRVDIPIQLGPWLLGIDYCHIRSEEEIKNRKTGMSVNEDWYVSSNTGMMGVIPAWKLAEMFNQLELKIFMAGQIDLAKRTKESNQSVVDLDVSAPAANVESSPSTKADNPSHREAFNSLVDAAVKTPRQDD